MAASATTARAAARRETFHEADVVVVGAGVLGCALAYALADQGRSVLLLERWLHEPDRIVGELLQPGGVAALRRLGLADCIDGIDGIDCVGYHVAYNGADTLIPYPAVDAAGNVPINAYVPMANGDGVNAHIAPAPNAPRGRSFHHGRFISQLRRRCLAHPNITVVETEATGLLRGGADPREVLGVAAKTAVKTEPPSKKDDYFFGQLTVVADGYASRFRSEVLGDDYRAPVVKSKFYALELQDCPLEPPGFGHVFINSAASPVLLYQIGTHETRALIDVPVGLPAAAAAAGGVRGYIRTVVVPSLPPALRPSVEAALDAEPGRIPRSMPNSWLPPPPRGALTRAAAEGVLLLGDAYNMRHPLTGGGMTVALNDAVLLADLLAPGRLGGGGSDRGDGGLGNHAAVAAAVGRLHWSRKRLTAIINVLAQALYALFAADSPPLRTLQLGCFAYFRRGWAAQPIGLLSGIIQQPLTLAYHFFSVAFLGIWLQSLAIVCGGGAAQKPKYAGGSSSSSSSLGLLGTVGAVARVPLAVADGIYVLWTACIVFLPVFWRELR